MILQGNQIKTTKRLLLTGARGFTGQHLIPLAQSAGYEIHALNANLNDLESLKHEVQTCSPDAVIHCAGISFVPSKDLEAFYRVHALGTSNLLKALAALDQKPEKILLASSATVYGNAAIIPTPEHAPLNPIDHYAMSKVAMEEMAKTFIDKLPIVIARPFNYTGVGQRSEFLIPKLIFHFQNQHPEIELGNLNIQREFNDVAMICDAYLALLQFGTPGESYNVSSGQPRSLHEVINILMNITGHEIQIKVNPAFVRTEEILCMSGCTKKLNELLLTNQQSRKLVPLENTLKNMLNFKNPI